MRRPTQFIDVFRISFLLPMTVSIAFERQVACTDGWDESTAQWASFYAYPRWLDPGLAKGVLTCRVEVT